MNYRIPDMVRQYTDYDMIQLHTELPLFPELRTRLLVLYLQQNIEASKQELFAMVTSLVQMGLDTHDLVQDNEPGEQMGEIRSRQLKVLAGDYFSSNFFYLLAKAGEIKVIKQLSTAICEVNHFKMDLYAAMKKYKLTPEQYLDQVVSIRMHLFQSFFAEGEDSERTLWSELLHALTACEVVFEEQQRLLNSSFEEEGWSYWYVTQQATREEIRLLRSDNCDLVFIESLLDKYTPAMELIRLLEKQWIETERLIEQLDSEWMKNEVKQIAKSIMEIASPRKIEVQ